MAPVRQWLFAPFRLDLDNACLWRGTQTVALKPKTFAVLQYLVEHAGRLVTKEEFFNAVWPNTAVGDAVLKVCIGELRKALGETARTPQFIATMHRRGYRFLAPVSPIMLAPAASGAVPDAAAHPSVPVLSAPPPSLVGRERVLRQLHAWLDQAAQGHRHVVLVTGEPGIGKTAVVEAFTSQAVAAVPVRLAWGQCVAQYGAGEPYLPVLEALGQLCQGPEGAAVVAVLRQQAPTWLVQMPWLLTAADRERLAQELQGMTRERMLREFAELVETLTAETPLLLVLEDLHWSDHATLDLMALLARRRTPARLLLVGTYRPVELIVQNHPLRSVAQDLQQHGYATVLPLPLLDVEAVTAYLAARFAAQHFPEAFASWLHRHTDGNPLFLVTLVETLMTRGVLTEDHGHWQLADGLEAVAVGVPEGLRPLLEQQLGRLPSEGQQVLEVASVAGMVFATATVAAGLEADVEQVERR
ncbi:MAG TPA: AAA family ATPase, partial [Candidatus Tectomicrobia bacterium]